MADEKYNLPYTGATVEDLLAQVQTILANIPTKLSDLTNDVGFVTGSAIPDSTSDLTNDSGFITGDSVPTKTSQLTNDSGFTTSAALSAEAARAQAAEALLASISALSAEVARAEGAEEAISDLVAGILACIPTAASDTNQLADKSFVNSSISSNTAHLITNNGQPFTSYYQLSQVTATENDYAYVVESTQEGYYYDRYKYSSGHWVLEYRVNSTVFTAVQWAAINSGISQALVTKLSGLPDDYNRITDSEINEICV